MLHVYYFQDIYVYQLGTYWTINQLQQSFGLNMIAKTEANARPAVTG